MQFRNLISGEKVDLQCFFAEGRQKKKSKVCKRSRLRSRSRSYICTKRAKHINAKSAVIALLFLFSIQLVNLHFLLLLFSLILMNLDFMFEINFMTCFVIWMMTRDDAFLMPFHFSEFFHFETASPCCALTITPCCAITPFRNLCTTMSNQLSSTWSILQKLNCLLILHIQSEIKSE